MSTLSGGQLHCSPIRIKCKRSLNAIAESLKDELYNGNKVPTTGWGSVSDDIEYLKPAAIERPVVGHPDVHAETAHTPRRLKARYYWDAADPAATRWLGDSADKRRTNHLRAVDLVLAEAVEDHEFVGVVTTRNDDELDYVERGLRNTFTRIDASSSVRLDSLDTAIASEFYLWLLHRYDGDQRLSEGLSLEIVRSLSSEDGLSRPTSLKSGADIDRVELAAGVLSAPNRFGPAQFAVQDDALELALELELHQDGSFKIVVSKSVYDGQLRRLPRELKGQRLVDDAVFTILPKVLSAYSSDKSWPNPGYTQLKRRAREVLGPLVSSAGESIPGEVGA
ncbi:hypothetical protein R1X32_42885 [Rhodococcus opacus]|uniref:hypothetical protein n=1 Tax=Rhodococcus opacus TaxID=37919 RepID=UPI0034D188EC